MFRGMLGREPTEEELQDIRLNLRMLERAGFAVDDPSNAPFIAPWAWMWARLPREEPPKVDQEALAAAMVKAMPPFIVQNRIDASVFKAALRDSFSFFWIGLAAACVVLAGFLGWHVGTSERTTFLATIARQTEQLERQQRVIDQLTPTHKSNMTHDLTKTPPKP